MEFSSRPFVAVGFLMLSVAVATWSYQVNQEVTAPYLDEVFHVRQALAYWRNEWLVWDPKITTPPGLYVLSYAYLQTGQLLARVRGHDGARLFAHGESMLTLLRGLNGLLLLASFLLVHRIWVHIRIVPRQMAATSADSPEATVKALRNDPAGLAIAAVVCSFPPFFFFSALYYTDVLSAMLVLLALNSSFCDDRTMAVFWGVLSLSARQTNFFWAGLFPAGVAVGRSLESIPQRIQNAAPRRSRAKRPAEDYDSSHGLDMTGAKLEDFVKSAFILVPKAVSQWQDLVRVLLPYVTVVFTFAAFVVVNGGVVLGDKSNHIASIHLSQMLYIWPYIAFFSWPVLLPKLLPSLLALLPKHMLLSLPSWLRPAPLHRHRLPRLVVILLFIAVALLVIHFNTLVHPFTLADNRHYTFYVFRILHRHPSIKYLAAPIYVILGWACIAALEAIQPPLSRKGRGEAQVSDDMPRREAALNIVAFISWLATCTLCLATAPLVEPRYCILPWIVWRLYVPLPPPSLTLEELITGESSLSKTSSGKSKIKSQTFHPATLNIRWTVLSLELAWFLMVNVATGYMFLRRGFEWIGIEEEEGNIQRFMW